MGAGVMFQKDGKALLLKRSKRNKDRWGGYWNFPGGTTEMGETPYETAVRESREEVETERTRRKNQERTRVQACRRRQQPRLRETPQVSPVTGQSHQESRHSVQIQPRKYIHRNDWQ